MAKRKSERERFEEAMKATQQFQDWAVDFNRTVDGWYSGQLENDLFFGWQLAKRDAKRRGGGRSERHYRGRLRKRMV
jgi:hypothetical protein